MADKFGYEGKVYYKVGGVGGGGAWTELTIVRSVSLNMSKGEADFSSRANPGWESTRGSRKAVSVDFEMLWDEANAGISALRDVYLDVTDVIGLKFLDGAEGSGKGFQADFDVFEFTREEPDNEPMTLSVSVKPVANHQWV
jgi:hypothetical protein